MADGEEGGVRIGARSLWLAATLATGAAVGGGGMTFASSPSGAVDSLGIAIATMNDDLKQLKVSVDGVAVSVVEIKADLRSSRRDVERLETQLKDHEQRIRAMEKKK